MVRKLNNTFVFTIKARTDVLTKFWLVPNPPQVTLLLHRESLIEDWEKANRTISFTVNNIASTSGEYKFEVISPSSSDAISNLIITTKATRTLSALLAVRHRLRPQSTVLLTQNGMGIFPTSDEINGDPKYRLRDSGTFIEAINTHGIFSNGPFSSTLAGKSDLTLSSPTKLNEASLAFTNLLTSSNVLNASLIPWQEFQIRKLEKLVVNACINPLTALFSCKNGELFTRSPIVQLMRLLLSEISQLLQSLPEVRVIEESEKSEDFDIPTRFSIEELELKVLEVADKTAANTSSMLQDVRANRETEIDYITGYLLKRGRECGVDMHFNAQVYDMVEAGRTLKAEDVVQEFGMGEGYLGALFDPLGWIDPRNLG
jgi:2-dehydropantoate 2-reductase